MKKLSSLTLKKLDGSTKSAALAVFLFAILGLAAGCASQRISSALERYGIAPQRAECMGDRLADRLSLVQLQSLNRAAKAYRAVDFSNGALAMSDLMTVALELRDPQIPLEMTSAMLRCSTQG